MRQHLFKAKRIDNGEWVEGGIAYYKDSTDEKVYIVINGTENNIDYFPFYEVNPDTVCEFTGLTDKNGKKIWENDIVKFSNEVQIGQVVWDTKDAQFGIKIFNELWQHTTFRFFEDFEAINNIFDKPELLERE